MSNSTLIKEDHKSEIILNLNKRFLFYETAFIFIQNKMEFYINLKDLFEMRLLSFWYKIIFFKEKKMSYRTKSCSKIPLLT